MSVEAAGRRYMVIVFLIWLPVGLLIAPMVLLMLERGLDLPTIAFVGAAYGVTTALLELPTGGLADVVGRRGVLILSALASLVAMVLFGFATTVAAFVVTALLRGVARALGSGPPEAWYVDTVHAAAGPDVSLVPGLARGEVAASLALALGTLVGGLLPLGLGDSTGSLPALAVPVFVAAAVEAVRVVVTLVGMPEPKHPRQQLGRVLREVPTTIVTGLRLGSRDVVLIRLLLAAAGVGVALAAVELLTPPWLAIVTGSREGAGLAYALVAALGFAADAIGSSLSTRLVRSAGTPAKAAMLSLAAAALALIGLAISVPATGTLGVVAAAVTYIVMFAALGATTAPQAELLHRRIGSGERATVLSIQSLLFMVVGTAGAIAIGFLADRYGPALPFAVSGLVLLGASAIFLRLPTSEPPSAGSGSTPRA